MARHRYAGDYIQTLATPGLQGARAYRLNHLGKLLKMKTGFINKAQGLCGYIFSSDGDTLSFSVFLNDYHINHKEAANIVDSIITLAAKWYNRERSSLDRADMLYSSDDIPDNYFERLIYFSKRLENTPYFLGPTGEGRNGNKDINPRIDLTRFDCVTYMEHTMALAMSRQTESLLPSLNNIRYFRGPPNYSTRKHFFVEDWIKKSPDYVKLFRFPSDTTLSRTMGKKRFFKSKGISFKGRNPITSLSYLPYDKALEMIKNWNFGRRFLGVGFVTNRINWLWVTHTGFLDATSNGKPKLRHASSIYKKVVSENFEDYLIKRKGKCDGVLFFEFVNQSVL
jgi:D-alanyl-D-alanine carboxypeptidase/D-alanyl-D-alanine-endopeptidase (penicillin-binding protein 4)